MKFAFRNLTSEEVLSQLQIGEIDLGVLREEEVTPMLAVSPALTYDYEAWVCSERSSWGRCLGRCLKERGILGASSETLPRLRV